MNCRPKELGGGLHEVALYPTLSYCYSFSHKHMYTECSLTNKDIQIRIILIRNLYIQNAYITLFYSISIGVRRCSAVPFILNARLNTTSSDVGSVVRITCLDGYVFPGNKTNQMLTCGANREWRPKIGHCRRT